MLIASDTRLRQVAVLGAAGRVGRAVTAALLQRDLHVDAVLREPTRHDLSHHPRLRVVSGRRSAPRGPVGEASLRRCHGAVRHTVHRSTYLVRRFRPRLLCQYHRRHRRPLAQRTSTPRRGRSHSHSAARLGQHVHG
ncbi:NAD(P)H-binding protein [Rugosimonospora africana]|uniref:NAD(P)H-binding protein n=1 Tax=Rugosimonospora africana TaxID=556532 RepID=UPI0019458B10